MNRWSSLILLLVTFQPISAHNADSLWKVFYNKNLPDTVRLKSIINYGWELSFNNPDSAILIAEKQLKLAIETHQKKYEGSAYYLIGISSATKSNYPKAVLYYLKALHIAEESGNLKGLATCYSAVGTIYKYQNDYGKALEYHLKALAIRIEMNDKTAIAESYSNLGVISYDKSDFQNALDYYFKAIPMFEESDSKRSLGGIYINIGVVYQKQGNSSKALEYYKKGLLFKRAVNDLQGIIICFSNISALNTVLKNYKLAILYGDSCRRLCAKTGDIDNERIAYENLATASYRMGNYKNAYEFHIKFKQLTDSIFNAENSKQLGDLKTQFEVQRKESELKLKEEAREAVRREEKKKEAIVVYSVFGILFVVLFFSIFLYKRYRITKKQKKIIEDQKQIVDVAFKKLNERNKEVMDSIHYAKRIQNALITSENYIRKHLSRLTKNKKGN